MIFFDLAAKRVMKQVEAPTPIFGLAANENSDTLYGVGRNQIVQWELKG